KYEDARLNLPLLVQGGGISSGAELGKESTTTSPDEFFVPDIIRKLDYLQATINELRETLHLTLRNQNRTIIEDLDGDEKIARLTGSCSEGTDAIYRVLTLLMTDDFAATQSLAGQRGKKSFKDRERIKSFVYSAVRTNPLMSSATHKDIDESIQNWLNKAPARIKARKKKPGSRDVLNWFRFGINGPDKDEPSTFTGARSPRTSPSITCSKHELRLVLSSITDE
ncbi:hypothetical protein Fcan01_01142, partial [Folsomia candida]